jgi:CDP-diacylglycerol--glycerol-3-phosphate 3-phosphatidyltransferase
VIGNTLRGLVDKFALPLGRKIGGLGISPNLVTLLGTFLVILACALIIMERRFLGAWVLAAGGFMDLLDGSIAKAMKAQSRRGAFLDSTTDRISDGALFATMAWILVDSPLGFGLALAALVLGGLTSYIRARAESLGFDCDVGIAERAERVILVIAGLVLGILVPMLAVLVVLSFVTVIQRFVHVLRQGRGAGPA